MKIKIKNIFAEIIASLFIVIFGYTAITKLAEREAFLRTMERSPLLGGFSSFLSWFIPITEIAACFLLFFPQSRKRGILFSLFLLMALTLYLMYTLLYADHLLCSCGGVISVFTWFEHLIFNLFLLALLVVALFLQRKKSLLQ